MEALGIEPVANSPVKSLIDGLVSRMGALSSRNRTTVMDALEKNLGYFGLKYLIQSSIQGQEINFWNVLPTISKGSFIFLEKLHFVSMIQDFQQPK